MELLYDPFCTQYQFLHQFLIFFHAVDDPHGSNLILSKFLGWAPGELVYDASLLSLYDVLTFPYEQRLNFVLVV